MANMLHGCRTKSPGGIIIIHIKARGHRYVFEFGTSSATKRVTAMDRLAEISFF